MLFMHNDIVASLLTMRECIDAQEHAFRQIREVGVAREYDAEARVAIVGLQHRRPIGQPNPVAI